MYPKLQHQSFCDFFSSFDSGPTHRLVAVQWHQRGLLAGLQKHVRLQVHQRNRNQVKHKGFQLVFNFSRKIFFWMFFTKMTTSYKCLRSKIFLRQYAVPGLDLQVYIQRKSSQKESKNIRSHRDLNSDRWIQSPKC